MNILTFIRLHIYFFLAINKHIKDIFMVIYNRCNGYVCKKEIDFLLIILYIITYKSDFRNFI